MPSFVSASDLEESDRLKDKVVPVECSRHIANNTLSINVTTTNTLDVPISVTGNLTLPAEFVSRVMNTSIDQYNLSLYDEKLNESLDTVDRTNSSCYVMAGMKGVIFREPYLKNRSSTILEFCFPVDDTFVESEYYQLELTWDSVADPSMSSIDRIEYSQTFNVTPFDWIDPESMQPLQSSRSSTCDLEITDVVVPDTSIWKGDSFVVELTIHNYGPLPILMVYINAKVQAQRRLYIGFDEEVTAYSGNGLFCIPYIGPSETITGSYGIGPYLTDDNRGIWALNGGMNAKDFTPEEIWYSTSEFTVYGIDPLFNIHTESFPFVRSFYVIQNPSEHVIFAAVVDDETSTFDAEQFFQDVVTNPIRIGHGMVIEPETTFEDEFDLDFRFLYVGRYDWPDYMHGVCTTQMAYRNTRYALGQALRLGSDWVSDKVTNPDDSAYDQGFTQRENHGFDIGLGLMPSGWPSHQGAGMSQQLGSVSVVTGTPTPNLPKVKEAALHEICHLFGALHGDDDEYEGDEFGPDFDGYTYIMAKGTGDDVGEGVWRMHDFTRDRIDEYYHTSKFDGAAYPQYDSQIQDWYGQTDCHAWFGHNQDTTPVYRLDSDGLYRWDYGSGHYTRFTITDLAWVSPEKSSLKVSTKRVDAEISYPNPGKAYFFVAYEISWLSDYWPSGWNPSSEFKLTTFCWIYQSSDRYGSTVDNVRIRVCSDSSSNPTLYYNAWFKASNPDVGTPGVWEDCHKTWGKQKIEIIPMNDTSIWYLFGFRDAWSADWHQKIYTHPISFEIEFEHTIW